MRIAFQTAGVEVFKNQIRTRFGFGRRLAQTVAWCVEMFPCLIEPSRGLLARQCVLAGDEQEANT